jgi:cyclomaltodextrinase / maltogenic alpha-amylase / neopullulanase
MELKHQILILLCLLALSGIVIYSCSHQEKPAVKPPLSEVKHTEWSRSSVIYEVNIRQYSEEGTFAAFQKDLPRLKELGIDLIWVMPINPIGIKNHKGKLGSYYSVKDYKAINPEYGKLDDFKNLVNAVHGLGMKIIIDWVPNHSSWDNELTKTHPEYYMQDSLKRFVSAFDWTDVIRFNYKNEGLRRYMTETMKWWLTETGIDGFRCDVAHMVPVDFWDSLRTALDSVRPVFMLAEADQPFLHKKAFDASYDWKLYGIMNQIAKGKLKATEVAKHFAWVDSIYPGDSYLMQFTSNHDENSWNGTEFERLGEGAKAFTILCATLPDMLLVYNGQESAFNRRLQFFEKDSISWGKYELTGFYKTLIALKRRNSAIWNGNGGRPEWVTTSADSSVIAYVRQKEGNKIFVLANLTAKTIECTIKKSPVQEVFKNIFSSDEVKLADGMKLMLKPWEYIVAEK